jgi:2-octaprenyl-6-methoxyphenol hydroxylase
MFKLLQNSMLLEQSQPRLPVLETLGTNSQSTQNASAPAFDYDLAIVGGGIVGATLACALKDSGLTIALIEAETQSEAIAKGQAYAVSLLSSRIYQGIGVWQAIAPNVAPFQQVRLSDADYPHAVHFLPKDLQIGDLGYVAEHRELLKALQAFLLEYPNIQWLCPVRVTRVDYQASGVELALSPADSSIDSKPSEEIPSLIRVRLLVAADGARSQIRQNAGIQTHGWQYWQSCIVATVTPEKPHNDIAYERFWPGGPFGILPMTENRCRIVWTEPHAKAKALVALDDAQFLEELQYRYGSQMGRLSLIGERFIFPVRLMHARRYTLPRLALIGDAAHCCHPVGGQGLNMGIRDAAALAQVLKSAHQQGEDIGQPSILKRYETWRRTENLAVLGFTDFLNRLFSNQWLPLVIIRRLGLRGMTLLQPLKSYALRFMTGLSGRSPKIAQN